MGVLPRRPAGGPTRVRRGTGELRRADVMHKMCVMGVRTSWRTVADGEFFCPDCGGDRTTSAGPAVAGSPSSASRSSPAVPQGRSWSAPPAAATSARTPWTTPPPSASPRCSGTPSTPSPSRCWPPAALLPRGPRHRRRDGPRGRLRGLLRGRAADPARRPRRRHRPADRHLRRGDRRPLRSPGPGPVRHSAGHRAPRGAGAARPAPRPSGPEALLLQGARIALADGSYTPAEREVLSTVGSALTLRPAEINRLLAAARTPS